MKNAFKILAWSLYDFSNQFFALNIISLYFARWLVIEKGAPEIFYSLAFGLSLAVVAVLAPLLGAISDAAGRPKYFLTIFTALSVVFTLALGFTQNIFVALLLFGIANLGCQIAVVFYNALLVQVAPPNKIGLISGLGRVFGYSGAVAALYLVNPRVAPLGYDKIFLATGLCFLIFALPCLLLLKDEPREPGIRHFFNTSRMTKTFQGIKSSLLATAALPGISAFLKCAFFGLIGVNIVILFMGVYAGRVLQLDERSVTHLIALGTVFAVAGSFMSGILCDIWGYKRTLGAVLTLWMMSFTYGAVLQPGHPTFFLSLSTGLALGATFTSARAAAAYLVPTERIGEVFALFNTVGYLASMSGALYWGALLFALTPLGAIRYRVALLSLNIFLAISLYFLSKIESA